MTMAETYSP